MCAAAGSSPPHALQWFELFASGAQAHIEFVRSTVKFDRDREEAGDAEYKPHRCARTNAVPTFALVAVCD